MCVKGRNVRDEKCSEMQYSSIAWREGSLCDFCDIKVEFPLVREEHKALRTAMC